MLVFAHGLPRLGIHSMRYFGYKIIILLETSLVTTPCWARSGLDHIGLCSRSNLIRVGLCRPLSAFIFHKETSIFIHRVDYQHHTFCTELFLAENNWFSSWCSNVVSLTQRFTCTNEKAKLLKNLLFSIFAK